jgi:DNA-binding IclR family transcriptional regulator
LVKVLETNKFLVKKTHSEQYWLGSKVLQLAAVFSEQSEISALATPILLDLRNSTRETVHLNIREENERVCIYCLEGFERYVPAIKKVSDRLFTWEHQPRCC